MDSNFQTAIVFVVALIALLSLLIWAGIAIYGTFTRVMFQRKEREANEKLWQERIGEAIARRQISEQQKYSWNGNRKFSVSRKVFEAKDICSFYLAPHDHKEIPPFLPGQFLTFRLRLPGQQRPIRRCYSLSDCVQPDTYRITVKRVKAMGDNPPGLISNYLIDSVNEGDTLDVQAPRGSFHIDENSSRPVVLLAGGVGITPLLSMANCLAKKNSNRAVNLFYGVRNKSEHAHWKHIETMFAERDHWNLYTFYSEPTAEDKQGKDYHEEGYINGDHLKRLLPSNNFEYYICGPSQMMHDLTVFLREWGVPPKDIHQEAFGAPSVAQLHRPKCVPAEGETFQIQFARSGKTITWKEGDGSLLDLAESHGVPIESGCRAGSCSSCLVAVKSGEVCYLNDPGSPPESGSCLTCITVPTSDMEIDI